MWASSTRRAPMHITDVKTSKRHPDRVSARLLHTDGDKNARLAAEAGGEKASSSPSLPRPPSGIVVTSPSPSSPWRKSVLERVMNLVFVKSASTSQWIAYLLLDAFDFINIRQLFWTSSQERKVVRYISRRTRKGRSKGSVGAGLGGGSSSSSSVQFVVGDHYPSAWFFSLAAVLDRCPQSLQMGLLYAVTLPIWLGSSIVKLSCHVAMISASIAWMCATISYELVTTGIVLTTSLAKFGALLLFDLLFGMMGLEHVLQRHDCSDDNDAAPCDDNDGDSDDYPHHHHHHNRQQHQGADSEPRHRRETHVRNHGGGRWFFADSSTGSSSSSSYTDVSSSSSSVTDGEE